MKRNIFILLGVGVGVITLGIVGFTVVYYAILQDRGGQLKNPPPGKAFSYEELLKLQDQEEQAAAEPSRQLGGISLVAAESILKEQAIAGIPRLIACFEFENEDLRVQAAETLKKLGAKAVDPVRARLNDKNAQVRFWTVQTLAHIGPDAADAVNEVLALVSDNDARVRYKAVYAIGKFGVRSDAVFAGLLKAIEDKDESVTETALEVLESIGTPPKEALPTLARLATKGSPENVRQPALKLLGRLGEPAVPTFKTLLKDINPTEATDTLKAVASLGVHAKPLLPELQNLLLTNAWFGAHQEMLGTFKKCGPEGADGLTSVLKKVSDPNSPQADPARGLVLLTTLGEMGSEAKSAVPVLIDLLKSSKPGPGSNLFQILETLGDIGPAASKAIPAVEMLLNYDPITVQAARVALRRMGKIDKQ